MLLQCLQMQHKGKRQAVQLTVGYQVTIGVGQAREGQQGQHDRQQCKLGKHNKAQQAGVLIQACCCNAQQASAQLNLPTPAVQRTLNAFDKSDMTE